jgi:hypothetical protein
MNNGSKIFGRIQQFNPEVIGWDLYAEQVALFWEANDIDDKAKRRAVLLTSIGSEAYGVLKNLTAPAKPAQKTLADVLKLLKKHYAPRPNPIVKRQEFYRLQLGKPDIDLCSLTKNVIPALGLVLLPVLYRGKRRQLTAYVVDGTGPNLLGRNWMAELGIYLSGQRCAGHINRRHQVNSTRICVSILAKLG